MFWDETAFNGILELKQINQEPKIIMYGKQGSYAQTYAQEHSELFEFVAK